MDKNDPLAAHIPSPTANRPLLGLTILAVEDSRYACEALRLLCLHSGARIRRADSLRSARRHLRVYRPTVMLVDLGLPDGNGIDLISELNAASPRVEALIAISGDSVFEADAMAAGADGFMEKPITEIALFQETILALLPPERRPKGPREIKISNVLPDPIAYHDDIAHIAQIMGDTPSAPTLDYVAQFVRGVARAAEDEVLVKAAEALADSRAKGRSATTEGAAMANLIRHRLADRLAI